MRLDLAPRSAAGKEDARFRPTNGGAADAKPGLSVNFSIKRVLAAHVGRIGNPVAKVSSLRGFRSIVRPRVSEAKYYSSRAEIRCDLGISLRLRHGPAADPQRICCDAL